FKIPMKVLDEGDTLLVVGRFDILAQIDLERAPDNFFDFKPSCQDRRKRCGSRARGDQPLYEAVPEVLHTQVDYSSGPLRPLAHRQNWNHCGSAGHRKE